jgi:hypothetical protein
MIYSVGQRISRNTMAQYAIPTSRLPRPRSYRAVGFVYVLLCGGLLALALANNKDFNAPPAPAPTRAQAEMARIQSFPDRKDMCKVLLFHNDTGRYSEGGTAPCQNMISKKIAIWTAAERAENFSKAFRQAW